MRFFVSFTKLQVHSPPRKFTLEKIGGTKNHLSNIQQREHNDCLVFKPKDITRFRHKVLLEILK